MSVSANKIFLKTKIGNNDHSPLKPLHERLKLYYEALARIFGENSKPTRSSRRMKLFWKNVKSLRRNFSVSVLDRPGDVRPYAEVQLLNKKVIGLLDTGASVSCLGSQAAMDLLNSNEPFRKLNTSVRTADGKPQVVIGVLTTEVDFKGKILPLTLFIVPSLSQNLILGMDFWRMFNLLPPALFSSTVYDPPTISDISDRRPLSGEQETKLQQLINVFPSFAKEGLGRTSVLCHVIDTGDAKQTFSRFSSN